MLYLSIPILKGRGRSTPRLTGLLAGWAVPSRQDGVQNADFSYGFGAFSLYRPILGSSWAVLALAGAVWGYLGAILGPSCAIFGDLGPISGHHKLSWGQLGLSWGRLGAILGLSWGHLGHKNVILPCVLQHFRSIG